MFKDQLGSTLMTFGADGTLTGRYAYEPFGKMIYREEAASNGMRRTFTGHMLEDDEGLYYCHARWYDSTVGRFLQADPVLDGFNRYAYCGNNPICYCDPSGMYDWGSNTIQEGDTLSQIAKDCNAKYGTNYTADDLQRLNSDTISDKDKIYAGNHLNLGLDKGPTKSPTAGYNYSGSTSAPKEEKRRDPHGADGGKGGKEVLSNAPSFADNIIGKKSNYYTITGNFFIGFGEFLSGIGIIVGGGFAASALAPETLGCSAKIGYDAVITGGALSAYGITRMAGANNKPFGEHVKSIFLPPMAVFADVDTSRIKK